jgi:hypothetical protein
VGNKLKFNVKPGTTKMKMKMCEGTFFYFLLLPLPLLLLPPPSSHPPPLPPLPLNY